MAHGGTRLPDERGGVPTTMRGSQPREDPAGSVRRWIEQRAAADPQMQAAAARRTPSPGAINDPDDNHDALTVLTRQHNQVNALVKQLQTVPGHSSGGSAAEVGQRATIVDMIRDRLTRHEAAEEQHLWPAVAKLLPDGEKRASQAREQEQAGNRTLADLGQTEPASDDYDDLVQQLIAGIRQHVAFEDKVFLDLLSCTDEPTRQQLGEHLLAAYAEKGPLDRLRTSPRETRRKEKKA